MEFIFNPLEVNGEIQVLEVGHSQALAHYRFGPRLRGAYILHIVTKGVGMYNGETLGEGGAFLVTPDVPQFTQTFDDPWETYWIMFNGKGAAALLERCHIPNISHTFSVENVQRLRLVFEKAISSKLSGTSRALLMTASLYELLTLLVENNQESVLSVEQAKQYIRTHLNRRITVSQIAARAGVSPKHLCKLFVRSEGVSPQEYLMQKKFQLAKELLLSTDHTIREVALSVGFDDACYFSAAFKRHVGLSPVAWRKAEKG